MSSACFITRDLWQKLDCPGSPSEIVIKTKSDEKKQSTVVVRGLRITSLLSVQQVKLPSVFVQDMLPIETSEIISHDDLKYWSHLSYLSSILPDRNSNISVGLLICANCTKALKPCEHITNIDNGPFTVMTKLGWSVSRPIKTTGRSTIISSDRTSIVDVGPREMLQQLYELDFNEKTIIIRLFLQQMCNIERRYSFHADNERESKIN